MNFVEKYWHDKDIAELEKERDAHIEAENHETERRLKAEAERDELNNKAARVASTNVDLVHDNIRLSADNTALVEALEEIKSTTRPGDECTANEITMWSIATQALAKVKR